VKGIGPKTALKRMHEWGSLDRSPPDVQAKLPANLQAIREFFLSPPVAGPEEIVTGRFRPEAVRKFLVDERDFASSRVESVVQRRRTLWRYGSRDRSDAAEQHPELRPCLDHTEIRSMDRFQDQPGTIGPEDAVVPARLVS